MGCCCPGREEEAIETKKPEDHCCPPREEEAIETENREVDRIAEREAVVPPPIESIRRANKAPIPTIGESSVRNDTIYSSPKSFTYEQLEWATENFKLRIGSGGFGGVYKGFLDDIGRHVAVKCLDSTSMQGNKEYLAEVGVLTGLDHPNIIKMIGCCAHEFQRLIVYEYMPLGSLDKSIHDIPPHKKPLCWRVRMEIAYGVAKGLQYLHDIAQPPVIHRDLKPSNILLGEGYFPKLSDFGIARIDQVGAQAHPSKRMMGTEAYIGPEYFTTGQITKRSDIYSFGIILIELITGRDAYKMRKNEGTNLVAWATSLFRENPCDANKFVDPLLPKPFPLRSLSSALNTAQRCVNKKAENRPVIAEVVEELQSLAEQAKNEVAEGQKFLAEQAKDWTNSDSSPQAGPSSSQQPPD